MAENSTPEREVVKHPQTAHNGYGKRNKRMNHVPESWLRKLNWAFAGYAMIIAVLYACAKYIPQASFLLRWVGNTAIPPGVAVGVVIYAFVAVPMLKKQAVWSAYIGTYLGALLVALFAVEVTGGYASHYFLIVMTLTFFGSMIGLYATMLPILLMFIGVVLVLLGSYQNPAGIPRMIITFTLVSASSIAGWLYWRKHYVIEEAGGTEAAPNKGLAGILKKERAQSEIILNAIEDGVLLIDSLGVIQLFNPAAAKITGWPTTEAVGIDHRLVIKLVDEKGVAYPEEKNPIIKTINTKTSARDNRAVLVSRSAKNIPTDFSVTPLIDPIGDVTGAVAIFRDVSKERGEEQQRAEFISTASHEMRTPVAAIEGYLALALNEHVSKIDNKAREYLEKAHSSTQHLGKLFQDLLTSAKAEDGRLVSHPVVVEMGEYLEQLTDSLRFSAEKKGLLMDFIIGAQKANDTTGGNKVVRPLYYTVIDSDRMREVITNLFDNAVKYTEAGRITIGLTGNDEVVQFYIKDTGPGIPAEDIPHLFQKFYRVDNSSTRTIGGTGLGLFISRKIVEMYNGRIWVESTLREGSSFYINLPRISTQKAEELKKKEAADALVNNAR